jgi:hypothetical protein
MFITSNVLFIFVTFSSQMVDDQVEILEPIVSRAAYLLPCYAETSRIGELLKAL